MADHGHGHQHVQFHGIHIQNYDKYRNMSDEEIAKLPPDERYRVEHARLHEKHRGHEAMHAEMVLILLITLAIAQIALVQWKKHHYKSYQPVTLGAMWLIPLFMSLRHAWYRFIVFWLIFSVVNAFVISRAARRPLPGSTPRLVYKWFLLLHFASYVLGIAGYIIFMIAVMGLPLIFGGDGSAWFDAGVYLLFYGLYYGVLGRDFAEICADKMASSIGYYTGTGLPAKTLEQNTCAVCGNHLLVTDNADAVLEKTFKLNCDHVFHEYCIRGWCIVGKKQTCPYCKEKVDLKRLVNPWERPHLLYGQLLDWIRYLVAWQPLIVSAVQGLNYMLGLE